jgi:hypothetical protein
MNERCKMKKPLANVYWKRAAPYFMHEEYIMARQDAEKPAADCGNMYSLSPRFAKLSD